MQPSRLQQPLTVVKGATFRQDFYLQQPLLQYRTITISRATAPLELEVPNHGLLNRQPIWIEGVSGMEALNHPYPGPAIYADVVDPDTLRFNDINGLQAPRAQGGAVIFQAPVDLTGCSARFEVLTPTGEHLFDVTGSITAASGLVTVSMPGTETAALTVARTKFRLWVTMSNGDVDPWVVGELLLQEAW